MIPAIRTITALWRTRTLAPDERAKIAEEQEQEQEQEQQDADDTPALVEDSGPYSIIEDTKLSKVLTVELPIKVKLFIINLLFS